MIIAIDFDGTIVSHQYPDIGKAAPGAAETIQYLYDKGYKLILWTCRYGSDLVDAVDFVHRLVPYVKWSGFNAPYVDAPFKSLGRKIYADFYIDDKSINIPMVEYEDEDGWLHRAVDWAFIKEIL
jgi:hydroxymethylpyrimidine pyrophosphatase-like HAD family hydrolase